MSCNRGGEKGEEEGGMKGEDVEGKDGEKTQYGRYTPHTCHCRTDLILNQFGLISRYTSFFTQLFKVPQDKGHLQRR